MTAPRRLVIGDNVRIAGEQNHYGVVKFVLQPVEADPRLDVVFVECFPGAVGRYVWAQFTDAGRGVRLEALNSFQASQLRRTN